MPAYDPRSTDSMFTEVLGRLEAQDKAQLEFRQEMKDGFANMRTKLGGQEERVRFLEKAAWRQRGAVGAIALAIPMLWEYFTKK